MQPKWNRNKGIFCGKNIVWNKNSIKIKRNYSKYELSFCWFSFKTILRLLFLLGSLWAVLVPVFAFFPISPVSPTSVALNAVCTSQIHSFARKIISHDRVKLNPISESIAHQPLSQYMTLFFEREKNPIRKIDLSLVNNKSHEKPHETTKNFMIPIFVWKLSWTFMKTREKITSEVFSGLKFTKFNRKSAHTNYSDFQMEWMCCMNFCCVSPSAVQLEWFVCLHQTTPNEFAATNCDSSTKFGILWTFELCVWRPLDCRTLQKPHVFNIGCCTFSAETFGLAVS